MLVLIIIFTTFVCASDKDVCPMLSARCEAHCKLSNNKPNCMSTCIGGRTTWHKPGDCPADDSESIDVFGLACLEACRYDAECPYTEKCCPNSCGVTCQKPLGLDQQIDLPAMPHDVTVESKRVDSKRKGVGKGTLIRWTKPNEDPEDSNVVYLLEARYHVGRHFSEPRLSEWSVWSASPEVLDDRVVGLRPRGLKMGTWYQFRVAAVNGIGSRGFSEHSAEFTPVGADPKPPSPPKNFRVEKQNHPGGQVTWLVKWDRPAHSDIPVLRYKLFWSRQISQGSLLRKHHTLSSEVTSYTLKNLEENSLYFLQVQALAQFGKARLKSEEVALLLNTTITDNNRRKRNHH